MLVSKQFLLVCQISKESEGVSGNHLLIWHGMTQVRKDGCLQWSMCSWHTVNCRINAFYFECKFHVLIYPKESLKWLRISVCIFNLFIDMWLIITDFCTDSNFDNYCAAFSIDFSVFYVSFVLQFYLNLFNIYFFVSIVYYVLLSAFLFCCLSFSIMCFI